MLKEHFSAHFHNLFLISIIVILLKYQELSTEDIIINLKLTLLEWIYYYYWSLLHL